MKAGALRSYITIQNQSASRDSYGGESVTWGTFGTVWAQIVALQGRELLAAQQVSSEVTGKVVIRYLSGVTAGMRVLYGSRVLNIVAVLDENERHAQMTLLYSEGLNNG